MYAGKFIFSQLIANLPIHTFRQCVARYQGKRYVKQFRCLDQYLVMAFAQLTSRSSLRDIEACLRAHQSKLYHMGIRSPVVARNALSKSQRTSRLAYLRRLCSISDSYCSTSICQGGSGSRSRQYNLRTQRIYDRPMSIGLSLGTVSLNQVRRKTSYSTGFEGKHPNLYPYFRQQVARCQRARHFVTETRCILYHGSWLCGFQTTLYSQYSWSIFRHSSQIKYPIPTSLLSVRGRIEWRKVRSNHSPNWRQLCIRLPAASTRRQILRRTDGENIHQILLRHIRERRQKPDMDCYFGLCTRCKYQEATRPQDRSLHNITNFESDLIRENIVKTATYK